MNKKNLMLDRRQALGLGAGMFGASALATLAGCSDGPSEPASNGGSDAAQTSSTDIDHRRTRRRRHHRGQRLGQGHQGGWHLPPGCHPHLRALLPA